jgi:hypothetical protein
MTAKGLSKSYPSRCARYGRCSPSWRGISQSSTTRSFTLPCSPRQTRSRTLTSRCSNAR